jgi:hypothetical protein
MYSVEVYAAVRQFVFVEERRRREAARVFGLNRETVAKICRFSVPQGYRRERPRAKPRLGPFITGIEAGAAGVVTDRFPEPGAVRLVCRDSGEGFEVSDRTGVAQRDDDGIERGFAASRAGASHDPVLSDRCPFG